MINITFIPDKNTTDTAIKKDECIIAAISFDGRNAYIAPEEICPEHHILLLEAGEKPTDIDSYFRIRFDRQSAVWTFDPPKESKFRETYYADGMRTISGFLKQIGYDVPVVIPERYLRNKSGKAWLLSADGHEIEVEAHPRIEYEPDRAAFLIASYGTPQEKSIAEQYLDSPDDNARLALAEIYKNRWCWVRVWGIPYAEVVFRINGKDDIWQKTISDFFARHPELRNCRVTVERIKK